MERALQVSGFKDKVKARASAWESSYTLWYPLVNVNKKLWKITMFNGKIHYFDWVIFNSFLYVYQRIICYIAIEHGPFIVDFPMKNGDFPVRYVNVYQIV